MGSPPIAGKAPAAAKKSSPKSGKPTEFRVRSGPPRDHHRIGIYGPGGIGKTSLAGLMSEAGRNPIVIDVDQSASLLGLPAIDEGLGSLDGVLAVLSDPVLDDFDTVVLDSVSRVEDLCARWVLANVPLDGGRGKAKSLEDYGFGKGYTHVYEAFLRVVASLDALFQRGKNVVLIAHDVVALTPNPAGVDFQRFEPRLLSPKSGRGSIRLLFKEWCDSLFFVGYDVSAGADGKAVGSGTRTIYCEEQAHFVAKSRTLSGSRPFAKGDASLWTDLFNVKGA